MTLLFCKSNKFYVNYLFDSNSKLMSHSIVIYEYSPPVKKNLVESLSDTMTTWYLLIDDSVLINSAKINCVCVNSSPKHKCRIDAEYIRSDRQAHLYSLTDLIFFNNLLHFILSAIKLNIYIYEENKTRLKKAMLLKISHSKSLLELSNGSHSRRSIIIIINLYLKK